MVRESKFSVDAKTEIEILKEKLISAELVNTKNATVLAHIAEK